MKLVVDRLGDSPTGFRLEADPDWWSETCALMPELEGAPRESFALDLEAHRMGADAYLEGTALGSVDLSCGRCLRRYRHALREPFRLVLEPAGERVPADPEGAAALARDGIWLGDDLETGWFRGSAIDLGPAFRELLALALPVQPVCREDCRGLCPRCGADRNVEGCGCAQAMRASPFAVLGRLKVRSPEGGE
jgi:uncharacterized protein